MLWDLLWSYEKYKTNIKGYSYAYVLSLWNPRETEAMFAGMQWGSLHYGTPRERPWSQQHSWVANHSIRIRGSVTIPIWYGTLLKRESEPVLFDLRLYFLSVASIHGPRRSLNRVEPDNLCSEGSTTFEVFRILSRVRCRYAFLVFVFSYLVVSSSHFLFSNLRT